MKCAECGCNHPSMRGARGDMCVDCFLDRCSGELMNDVRSPLTADRDGAAADVSPGLMFVSLAIVIILAGIIR